MNNFTPVTQERPTAPHFYVFLNRTGTRMVAWGQFDAKDPDRYLHKAADGEMDFDPENPDKPGPVLKEKATNHETRQLVDVDVPDNPVRERTRISRWAVKQPMDKSVTVDGKQYPYGFRELKNGQFFWVGEPAAINHLGYPHPEHTSGAAAAWAQKEMEKL